VDLSDVKKPAAAAAGAAAPAAAATTTTTTAPSNSAASEVAATTPPVVDRTDHGEILRQAALASLQQQQQQQKPVVSDEVEKAPPTIAAVLAAAAAAAVPTPAVVPATPVAIVVDEPPKTVEPPPPAAVVDAAAAPPAPLPPAVTAPPPPVAAKAVATKPPPPPPARRIYTKDLLIQYVFVPFPCNLYHWSLTIYSLVFRLKETAPKDRPSTLPDFTITKVMVAKGGGRPHGGSGRGGGGGWERSSGTGGAPRRQSNTKRAETGGGDEWSRGQAPPRIQQQQKGGRGRGGGRGMQQQQQPLYDGPIVPLVKSENHWRPKKNTSALVVHEKKVKSILNKMTKEKFDRLSQQMIELPILSFAMLEAMIQHIYDKAVDEPLFGDMYADLCVRLSQTVQVLSFVHVIESDEEPPTEGDDEPSHHDETTFMSGTRNTVYRWSNDVSTTDSEIVGPFQSADECIAAALAGDGQPQERGDRTLDLVKVQIRQTTFIKILRLPDNDQYYAVYMPVSEAQECGQQLSGIFLSQQECVADAAKFNAFKRSLLNKCEEEFLKEDIYTEWEAEKASYEMSKASLTEAERAEKEEVLEFRRIKIKKQMIGNIKFVGQLYRKNLLKERIMRSCVGNLLKIDLSEPKGKPPVYTDLGSNTMDEEDHEAVCTLLTTMGAMLDHPQNAAFMNFCFAKIKRLCVDEALPSRCRFLYKDLIELRASKWTPRRKEEKAKTLEEVKKEFEKEERNKERESQQMRVSMGGRGGGGGDYRGGRQQQSFSVMGSKGRNSKPTSTTDDDGFTTIPGKSATPLPKIQQPRIVMKKDVTPAAPAVVSPVSQPAPVEEEEPMSNDEMKRRVKSICTDFMNDGGNVTELLLSFDELRGTDVGKALVTICADNLSEARDAERNAIFSVISTLFEQGKITVDDVKSGLGDFVEFIDSAVMDAPRLFEYTGNLFARLLRLNAIDMLWICEAAKLPRSGDEESPAPENIVRETLKALKKFGMDEVHKHLTSDVDKALTELVGAESYMNISSEVLS
jgi:translation initiation factor 4G